MAHSSHRRWKGHCLLCASNAKLKGAGRSSRDPWPVRRKLGRKRRYGRGCLGDSASE
jgi:hypothetical protein